MCIIVLLAGIFYVGTGTGGDQVVAKEEVVSQDGVLVEDRDGERECLFV
jgi:hypothetical protein